MTFWRNTFMRVSLSLAAAVIALGTIGATTATAAWPEKPVRILVSFPPGGGSDLVARLLAENLTKELGQQFVVQNKPGAAGTVATTALKKAKADGYTFMLSNLTPFNVAPVRFPNTPYDPIDDFTHVSYIGAVYLGLFVSPKVGVKTLAELIAKAKKEPGKLDYGTSGVGSWGHVVSAQFKALTGVDMVHIPYKGSRPMRLDFRSGVVPITFDALPQNLPAIKEGLAIPLAISSKSRIPTSANIPTFMEQGLLISAENWLGITAPAGLNSTIASKVDAALQKAKATEKVKKQFATWGVSQRPMTSAQFRDFVAAEGKAWRPLVKKAIAK